jgi:hypothetical protein
LPKAGVQHPLNSVLQKARGSPVRGFQCSANDQDLATILAAAPRDFSRPVIFVEISGLPPARFPESLQTT